MSQATPCRVGAVVVNYDAGSALTACVASLRAAGITEIAVVDNGSHDGSLAALAAADPAVHLFPLGRNLGYGTAANRGVERLGRLAGGLEMFLVCNPDIELDPSAVARLVEVAERFPDTAVLGPALLWPSGERYPSARAFPSYGTAVAHGLLGMFFPDNPWSRRYRRQEAVDAGTAGGQAVDWVSGACFLVRQNAFQSVAGFDEGYFMYVEDLDLCWRLRRAGWKVRYVPAARAVHEQGRSTRRRPYRMLIAHHRSTWRFARRRASGPGYLALPAIGAGIALRLAAALVQQALGGNRAAGGVD